LSACKNVTICLTFKGEHTVIGRVTSIESKGIEQKHSKQGQEVSIKIEPPSNASVFAEYNRQFNKNNLLASKVIFIKKASTSETYKLN